MDDEEAEAARAEADGLRQFEQTCVAWDKQKGGLLRLTEKFLGLVEGRNGHDDPAVYLPKLAVLLQVTAHAHHQPNTDASPAHNTCASPANHAPSPTQPSLD